MSQLDHVLGWKSRKQAHNDVRDRREQTVYMSGVGCHIGSSIEARSTGEAQEGKEWDVPAQSFASHLALARPE